MSLDDLDFPALRREMNHLVWVDGFINRNTYDMGWGCRDHTWLLSAVLASHDVEHEIVTGKAMFVQGPTGNQPSCGLGNAVPENAAEVEINDTSHSWLEIDGRATYDLSPNLKVRKSPWRPVKFDGIIASRWMPDGEGGFLRCTSRGNYQNMINRATHQENRSYAVYWPRRREEPTEEILDSPFEWVHSPQTVRLSEFYAPDIYQKIVGHLLGVLTGERKSLVSKSRKAALAKIDDECAAKVFRPAGGRKTSDE